MIAGKRQEQPVVDQTEGGDDLQSRIDRIAARLDRLTQAGRGSRHTPVLASAAPAATASPLSPAARSLQDRLDALAGRTRANPASISRPPAVSAAPAVATAPATESALPVLPAQPSAPVQPPASFLTVDATQAAATAAEPVLTAAAQDAPVAATLPPEADDAEDALSQLAAALQALDAHGPGHAAADHPAPTVPPVAAPIIVPAHIAAAEAPAAPSAESSLREAARRADEASAARWAALLSDAPRPASLSAAAPAEEDRAARRLANLSGRATTTGIPAPSQPQPASSSPSRLDAAIAEIAERQKVIDTQARQATGATPRLHGPDDREELAASLRDLRADLAALNRTTAGLGALTDRQREAIDALAVRVAAIDEGSATDRRELAGLRIDVAGLRRLIEDTARESTLKTMEAGYGHIIERLDEVSRNAATAGRLEELAAEIFGRLPEAGQLDQLGRDVARLTEVGSADALASLQRRVDDIAGQITGALAQAPRADTVGALVARLETVVERLDRGGPGEPAPSETLLQALAEELSETRRLVAERPVTAAPSDTAALRSLEDQMRLLAERLDQVGPGAAGQTALDQLELQVAALTVKLDDLTAVPEAFAEVGKGLGRLEAILADRPTVTADDMRKVARETYGDLRAEQRTAADAERALIAGLQDDLRRVQAAGAEGDARNAETIGSVQGTLDRIAARLESLEVAVRTVPEPLPARLPVAAPAAGPAAAPTAHGVTALPAGPGTDAAKTEAARATAFDENRPLAPGSGRPAADENRDRKADFIAAARRAAQAAAAESKAYDPAGPASGDRPGPLSRFSQVFKNRRRPLLLAAAAVILTIAVVRVLGPIGSDPAVARAPLPTALPPAEDRATAGVAAANAALPASPLRAAEAANPTPAQPRLATARPSEAPRSVAGQATTFGTPAATLSPPLANAGALAFAPPETPAGNFARAFAAAGVTAPAATAAQDDSFAADLVAAPMPEEAIGPMRLRVAAAGGDPAALFEVATRYADGRGVAANAVAAAEWYERAAERGVAVAQFRLGALYERGQGVAADRTAAASWYERAAAQGHVQAMHNLAVLYSEGVGGAPDYAAATRWFAAAAEHGVRDSQYNLGVIAARGIAVAQDLVASYKWFALAAAQGDTDAAARRDDVAATLTPDRLATARAAVAAFVPKTPDRAGNTAPSGDWAGADSRVTEAERQELVRRIQSLLAENGYDPGPADGLEGPKTREAARAFRAAQGLPDGRLDETLLAALDRQG